MEMAAVSPWLSALSPPLVIPRETRNRRREHASSRWKRKVKSQVVTMKVMMMVTRRRRKMATALSRAAATC